MLRRIATERSGTHQGQARERPEEGMAGRTLATRTLRMTAPDDRPLSDMYIPFANQEPVGRLGGRASGQEISGKIYAAADRVEPMTSDKEAFSTRRRRPLRR